MSGKSSWNRQSIDLWGDTGKLVTGTFKYLGSGTVEKVVAGCSCIKRVIKGNTVSLTYKVKKKKSITKVVSVSVMENGREETYNLRLNIKNNGKDINVPTSEGV